MTKWTQADVDAHIARVGAAHGRVPVKTYPLSVIEEPVKAKGALKPRKMNKTEREYGCMLEARGDVAWCEFEGVTLRLGDDCRYTPDFILMLRDGTMECHETKGFMRDDALVKIKVAAARYPFKFVLVRKTKGEWSMTEIRP